MEPKVTECIYCSKHCSLSEPGCGRGRRMAEAVEKGSFDLDAALAEKELRARGRNVGETEHRGHRGHRDHREHHWR